MKDTNKTATLTWQRFQAYGNMPDEEAEVMVMVRKSTFGALFYEDHAGVVRYGVDTDGIDVWVDRLILKQGDFWMLADDYYAVLGGPETLEARRQELAEEAKRILDEREGEALGEKLLRESQTLGLASVDEKFSGPGVLPPGISEPPCPAGYTYEILGYGAQTDGAEYLPYNIYDTEDGVWLLHTRADMLLAAPISERCEGEFYIEYVKIPPE